MASNQTANFGLNQWAAEDSVLREEFNADNAKIDAALAALGRELIYTGSYVGDGTSKRTIQLPITPKFIILMGRVLQSGMIGIFTQDTHMYVTKDSVGMSADYAPLLSGSQLIIQNEEWCNHNGQSVHYIAVA